MLIQTGYEHIIIEDGVARIKGTSMKVIELVLEHQSYGWSPEELKYQHPYLELGQIYSALSYYYDHKEELDKDIEQRLSKVDGYQKKLKPSSLRKRLEAKGLL